MFISQVIFESKTENKDEIVQLMNKKSSDVKSATGLISSECWWKEGAHTVGFSLVLKWNNEEDFKNWMKESHKDGHGKQGAKEMEITKTLFKFNSSNE